MYVIHLHVEHGGPALQVRDEPQELPEDVPDPRGSPRRGWLVDLQLIIFLDFPQTERCLLVWDSGPQAIYENLDCGFANLPFRFY